MVRGKAGKVSDARNGLEFSEISSEIEDFRQTVSSLM